jgi:hypothetical protein
LEFVALQNIPYNQLSNNFIALAMKDKLDQAKESNKATIVNLNELLNLVGAIPLWLPRPIRVGTGALPLPRS